MKTFFPYCLLASNKGNRLRVSGNILYSQTNADRLHKLLFCLELNPFKTPLIHINSRTACSSKIFLLIIFLCHLRNVDKDHIKATETHFGFDPISPLGYEDIYSSFHRISEGTIYVHDTKMRER